MLDTLEEISHIVNGHICNTSLHVTEYCKKRECWEKLLEDEAGKRQEHQEQIQSLSQQIVATQHRLENLVTALADNVLPSDIIKQRYLEEEIKKKQLEGCLNELSLLDGSTPIDLDKFRELLQQELGNEDSRKAALQGLIEEIVVHPDYTMEVKYRIGGNDPVGSAPYPHESRYAHGGPNPGICSLHLYFNVAILSS